MLYDYYCEDEIPIGLWFIENHEDDAKSLSRRYNLKEKEVLMILRNLSDLNWYFGDSPSHTIFEKALQTLTVDEALNFFKYEDLVKHRERYNTLSQVKSHEDVNIYPFKSLASRLKKYIENQNMIRERMIDTGFVNYMVRKYTGLNRYLITLYYVKPYYKYLIFSSEKDFDLFIERYDNGNIDRKTYAKYHKLIRNYTYIDYIDDIKRSADFNLDKDVLYIGENRVISMGDDGSEIQYGPSPDIFAMLRSYEETDYFDFLPEGMGKQLDELRPKVFDLRLEILKRLLKAMKSEDTISLWDDCANLIKAMNFTYDEIELLLKADKILSNLDEVPDDDYYSNMVHNAGLTDLFYVIGFLENEIVNRTEEKISEIWKDNNLKSILISYFDVLKLPDCDRVIALLDQIIECERVRREYIENYNVKLKNFVENSLMVKKVEFIPKKNDQFWDTHRRQFDKMVEYYDGEPLKKAKEKTLTPKQEKDYEKYEYLCYDKLNIPGTQPKKRSNIIHLNGNEVKIGNQPFILLVRFVLELKSHPEGWVNTRTLEEEKIVNDKDDYRPYSNLKTPIKGYLLKKNANDFIQNDGSGNYRLSTHPSLVTYERNKLLSHELYEIREIAKKLPKSR